MPSELALKYQEAKKTLPIRILKLVDQLDAKFNEDRLVDIAPKAVGKKCLGAEAVAVGGCSL